MVALKRSLAGVVSIADTASPGLEPVAAAATTVLFVCAVYCVRFTVETVPSAFLTATATLSVFSVPLVAGVSTLALEDAAGALSELPPELELLELPELELLELLELPDVELEAANAVSHIMVHNEFTHTYMNT